MGDELALDGVLIEFPENSDMEKPVMLEQASGSNAQDARDDAHFGLRRNGSPENLNFGLVSETGRVGVDTTDKGGGANAGASSSTVPAMPSSVRVKPGMISIQMYLGKVVGLQTGTIYSIRSQVHDGRVTGERPHLSQWMRKRLFHMKRRGEPGHSKEPPRKEGCGDTFNAETRGGEQSMREQLTACTTAHGSELAAFEAEGPNLNLFQELLMSPSRCTVDCDNDSQLHVRVYRHHVSVNSNRSARRSLRPRADSAGNGRASGGDASILIGEAHVRVRDLLGAPSELGQRDGGSVPEDGARARLASRSGFDLTIDLADAERHVADGHATAQRALPNNKSAIHLVVHCVDNYCAADCQGARDGRGAAAGGIPASKSDCGRRRNIRSIFTRMLGRKTQKPGSQMTPIGGDGHEEPAEARSLADIHFDDNHVGDSQIAPLPLSSVPSSSSSSAQSSPQMPGEPEEDTLSCPKIGEAVRPPPRNASTSATSSKTSGDGSATPRADSWDGSERIGSEQISTICGRETAEVDDPNAESIQSDSKQKPMHKRNLSWQSKTAKRLKRWVSWSKEDYAERIVDVSELTAGATLADGVSDRDNPCSRQSMSPEVEHASVCGNISVTSEDSSRPLHRHIHVELNVSLDRLDAVNVRLHVTDIIDDEAACGGHGTDIEGIDVELNKALKMSLQHYDDEGRNSPTLMIVGDHGYVDDTVFDTITSFTQSHARILETVQPGVWYDEYTLAHPRTHAAGTPTAIPLNEGRESTSKTRSKCVQSPTAQSITGLGIFLSATDQRKVGANACAVLALVIADAILQHDDEQNDAFGTDQGTENPPGYLGMLTQEDGLSKLVVSGSESWKRLFATSMDAQTGAAAGSKLDDDLAPGHEMIADEPLSTAQTNRLLELFPDMCLDIDTALHSLHELGDVISDGLTICRRESHIAFVRDHDGAPCSMTSSITTDEGGLVPGLQKDVHDCGYESTRETEAPCADDAATECCSDSDCGRASPRLESDTLARQDPLRDLFEGTMSLDDMVREVEKDFVAGRSADDNLKAAGCSKRVYILSWSGHHCLLVVGPAGISIVDTLGERLDERLVASYVLHFPHARTYTILRSAGRAFGLGENRVRHARSSSPGASDDGCESEKGAGDDIHHHGINTSLESGESSFSGLQQPLEETPCGAFGAVRHYLRHYMMRGLRLECLVDAGSCDPGVEPSVLWQERAFAQAQVELQRVVRHGSPSAD